MVGRPLRLSSACERFSPNQILIELEYAEYYSLNNISYIIPYTAVVQFLNYNRSIIFDIMSDIIKSGRQWE